MRAFPAAIWIKEKTDKTGRAIVKPNYSLSSQPNVFVIGDTASLTDTAGNLVPGLAPQPSKLENT